MRTILVTLALTFGMVAAASATSPAVGKRTVTAPANKYWLSDGLNRLVFWQPPSTPRGERQARQ